MPRSLTVNKDRGRAEESKDREKIPRSSFTPRGPVRDDYSTRASANAPSGVLTPPETGNSSRLQRTPLGVRTTDKEDEYRYNMKPLPAPPDFKRRNDRILTSRRDQAYPETPPAKQEPTPPQTQSRERTPTRQKNPETLPNSHPVREAQGESSLYPKPLVTRSREMQRDSYPGGIFHVRTGMV